VPTAGLCINQIVVAELAPGFSIGLPTLNGAGCRLKRFIEKNCFFDAAFPGWPSVCSLPSGAVDPRTSPIADFYIGAHARHGRLPLAQPRRLSNGTHLLSPFVTDRTEIGRCAGGQSAPLKLNPPLFFHCRSDRGPRGPPSLQTRRYERVAGPG